jgi:hypothetical protein
MGEREDAGGLRGFPCNTLLILAVEDAGGVVRLMGEHLSQLLRVGSARNACPGRSWNASSPTCAPGGCSHGRRRERRVAADHSLEQAT